MTGSPLAKAILEAATGEHPLVSAVFDLDPSRFRDHRSRAAQVTSLIDAAHKLELADASLGHDARKTLRADLHRLEKYLGSEEYPVSHAGALAIYVSTGDDLFETVVLSQPRKPEIHVDRHPFVEPVAVEPASQRWCAVLVTSRDVALVMGEGAKVNDRTTRADYVRGHSQSDGNDEHSRAQDIDGHLIDVAKALATASRAGDFDILVMGGPTEPLSALHRHLASDVTEKLMAEHLNVDPSAATDSDVAAAVVSLLLAMHVRERKEIESRFTACFTPDDERRTRREAAAGVHSVLEALVEQRVETLLVSGGFHLAGTRCRRDGLLHTADVLTCPADGSATFPVPDLRPEMIAAAVRQDAGVLTYDEPSLALSRPDHQIGALLRF